MDPGSNEMAMFRFSLIAPAVNGTYTQGSKAAYYREVEGRLVRLPDGSDAHVNASTLAYWEWRYRHGGFEALGWARRSDLGDVRALTPGQVAALECLRAELPRLSATGLRGKMIELGHMDESDASVSTFQRYVRNHPLAPPGPEAGGGKGRRAFQAESPGDLWQADTMFGPHVVIDDGGHRGRAYLQMLLDDRARLIVGGRFWARDNARNFQKTLRRSVEVWGIPRALYCDNGGAYKNGQLTGICGRLGTVLRHTPVRDGAAKGKVLCAA